MRSIGEYKLITTDKYNVSETDVKIASRVTFLLCNLEKPTLIEISNTGFVSMLCLGNNRSLAADVCIDDLDKYSHTKINCEINNIKLNVHYTTHDITKDSTATVLLIRLDDKPYENIIDEYILKHATSYINGVYWNRCVIILTEAQMPLILAHISSHGYLDYMVEQIDTVFYMQIERQVK